jgi:tripartite-type tricarboxylate transporter receptor subunit TctC
MNRRTLWMGAAVLGCLLGTSAHAQNYPTQRVTLVVPFAAGGPTDVVGRTVGAAMEQLWKQPFIIENKPGAGGHVGTEFVSRAKPDGYTLLFNGNGPRTAKFFMKDIPYNPSDLRAVVKMAGSQYVLVVHPSVPASNLQELIALAKAKPKSINYGTFALTTYEFDYQRFQQAAGVEMTPVSYNSAAPTMTALLRNEIQFYFGIQGSILAMVNEGKMKPIAMLGAARANDYPNVPTAREQGLDFQAGFGFGILVHSKTPEDLVQKIGRDIAGVLKTPAVADKLKSMGYDVPPSPLDWPKELDVELKAYEEIAQRLGIKPQ